MKTLLIALFTLAGTQSFAAPLICELPSGEKLTAYVEEAGELSTFSFSGVASKVAVDAVIPIGTRNFHRYIVSVKAGEFVIFFLPSNAGTFEDHENFDGFISLPPNDTLLPMACRQGLN